MKATKTMFVLGLLIVLLAAAIGIVGIGLIAALGRSNMKRKS